jgi:hypothetical protein
LQLFSFRYAVYLKNDPAKAAEYGPVLIFVAFAENSSVPSGRDYKAAKALSQSSDRSVLPVTPCTFTSASSLNVQSSKTITMCSVNISGRMQIQTDQLRGPTDRA